MSCKRRVCHGAFMHAVGALGYLKSKEYADAIPFDYLGMGIERW